MRKLASIQRVWKIEPLFEEFVDFETFSKSDFRAVKNLERFHGEPKGSI